MTAPQKTIFLGEEYRNFICSIKSKATKDSYTKALRQFMKFREILSCEGLLKDDSRRIQFYIIEWMLLYLKEVKNLSSASITLYCSALRHFYDMNDYVGLNWKKVSSFIGEQVKTVKDRPYTRAEIRKLVDSADDKPLKIAFMLMCSSGIRIGAISSLKVNNLTYLPKYGIYQIVVYENTRDEYVTFCSPECIFCCFIFTKVESSNCLKFG